MTPDIFNRSELECSVCGQPIDRDQQTADAREITLVGAAAYAWCPSCGRQVAQPWDAAYKVRWTNAFSDWCRSQQKREARQPRTTTVRMTSPKDRAVELAMAPTETGFDVRWVEDGEVRRIEHFASRESGSMRLQEIEAILRSQGYRVPGEPIDKRDPSDLRPRDVWMSRLADGRQARATLIPMGNSVTLAFFIDDHLQDIHDCHDWDTALRKAEQLRLALIAGRRDS